MSIQNVQKNSSETIPQAQNQGESKNRSDENASCCQSKGDGSSCCKPDPNGIECCEQPADGSACCEKESTESNVNSCCCA